MQIGIVIRHEERQHLRPAFLKQCKVLFSFCIQHNYQRTLCTLKKSMDLLKPETVLHGIRELKLATTMLGV